MASGLEQRYHPHMKLPESSTPPYLAAALLGAMCLAFVYLGISKSFPVAFLGAAIFSVGVGIAIRRALRKPDA
jgi:hypothetical protein